MAQYDGMVLTDLGAIMLAKSQLGVKMEFTKVVIGDGKIVSGMTFQTMEQLVNEKMTLKIQNVEFVKDGQVDLTAIVSNAGLDIGFFVREIGVFARSEDGVEVLYAYTNAGDYADYLPNAKINEVSDVVIVSVLIANSESITVNINDSVTLATKADINRHNHDREAHPEIIEKISQNLVWKYIPSGDIVPADFVVPVAYVTREDVDALFVEE